MDRFSLFEKQISMLTPIRMICALLAVIVISCGDPSLDSGNTTTDQPASASFSILWRTDSADQSSENNVLATEAISDDCAGMGVATVECLVYDGASMRLLTTGSWPCSEAQGALDDIPPGEDRQFVVLGLNDNGEIVYRGQAADGIDFDPGQFVDVGYIEAFPFAARLPDTGQTKSFTDTYGEDSDYQPKHPHLYTKIDDNGNALDDSTTEWVMVRDEVTGLTWEVKTDDDSIHDVDNLYTWQEAQDKFITQLNRDNFGGYSDWRLPTIKEFFSIADKSVINPAINTDYFPNIMFSSGGFFWSSTAYVNNLAKAWFLKLLNGDVDNGELAHLKNVNAVRGEQINSTLVDNEDGTVTDTATGLMWQQAEAGAMTWEEALTYCEDLKLAGYNDWRLPNINQLQSIVDYIAYAPSINQTIFPEAMPQDYWSSTTYEGDDDSYNRAWSVQFSNGELYADDKSNSIYVRAVRYADSGN
jgi:hypothetical protein